MARTVGGGIRRYSLRFAYRRDPASLSKLFCRGRGSRVSPASLASLYPANSDRPQAIPASEHFQRAPERAIGVDMPSRPQADDKIAGRGVEDTHCVTGRSRHTVLSTDTARSRRSVLSRHAARSFVTVLSAEYGSLAVFYAASLVLNSP